MSIEQEQRSVDEISIAGVIYDVTKKYIVGLHMPGEKQWSSIEQKSNVLILDCPKGKFEVTIRKV